MRGLRSFSRPPMPKNQVSGNVYSHLGHPQFGGRISRSVSDGLEIQDFHVNRGNKVPLVLLSKSISSSKQL